MQMQQNKNAQNANTTKYKYTNIRNNKNQMGQNAKRQNTKVTKYRWNKIQTWKNKKKRKNTK